MGTMDRTEQCTRCGATIAQRARFCTSCGTAVEDSQATVAESRKTEEPSSAVEPTTASTMPAGPSTNSKPSNWKRPAALVGGVVALVVVALLAGFAAVQTLTASDKPLTPTTTEPTVKEQMPAPGGIAQVTVNVRGCDDCTITAEWSASTNSGKPVNETELWNSGELPVRDGKVSFPVPVDKSHGLSFDVFSARDKKEARNVAAIRYQGFPEGTPITPEQAATATEAYGCWAGTTFATATLDLQVDWYTGPSLEGVTSPYLRAYFNPGLATYGDKAETYSGGLSHQNIWSCGF